MTIPYALQPRYRLHQRLRARERVLGVNPQWPDPELVAHCVQLGAELIFIDCEHGGPSVESVTQMRHAAQAHGAATVLRPWSKDPGLLRRYIDGGIDGLIVPDLQGPDELLVIRQLLRDCDPPGREAFLLIGLIESVAALETLPEILATGAADALLVGAGDLAVSAGYPRRSQDPAIREWVFGVLQQAQAAGVSAGAPVDRFGAAQTAAAGGNLLMFFARDLLRRGWQEELKSL